MSPTSTARRIQHEELTLERASSLASLLRALGHPLRLRIIDLLCREEINVNALAERLDAPQAVVSQQLRILRMSRLVAVRREGSFAKYRLAEPRLRNLLRCMDGCTGL